MALVFSCRPKGQAVCYRAPSWCPSDSASHFSKACYLIKCIIHYSPSPMIYCAFKSACAHIKTSNKNHQEKPLHSNCSIKMIPSPAFLLGNTVYSTWMRIFIFSPFLGVHIKYLKFKMSTLKHQMQDSLINHPGWRLPFKVITLWKSKNYIFDLEDETNS